MNVLWCFGFYKLFFSVWSVNANENMTNKYPGPAGPVENLTAFCVDSSEMGLKLQSPNPPTRNVSHYEIQVESKIYKVNNTSPCKSWDNFQCAYLNDLLEKTSYKVVVRAIIENVDEPPEFQSITVNTIHTNKDYFDITLKWSPAGTICLPKTPPETIQIQSNLQNRTFELSENMTDFPIHQLTNLSNHDIYITIRSSNSTDVIYNSTVNLRTFVHNSSFEDNFLIKICSRKCKLKVPKPKNFDNSSEYLLLMEKNASLSMNELSTIYKDNPTVLFNSNISSDCCFFIFEIGNNNSNESVFYLLRVNNQNVSTFYVLPIKADAKEPFKGKSGLDEPATVTERGSDPIYLEIGRRIAIVILSLLLVFMILLFIRQILLDYYFSKQDSSFENKLLRILFFVPYEKTNIPGEATLFLSAITDTPSHKISVSNLENYLMTSKDVLNEEYENLPLEAANLSTVHGEMLHNSSKNWFTNILPYDQTRVILRGNSITGDYINANYIKGYDKRPAFIAAQAPMENTLHDFWWMIWQENVNTIIMLTNLVENGVKKCVKYWPDSSVKYGEIFIGSEGEEEFLNFVVRKFLIRHGKDTPRMVQQFQFKSWPDHGTPLHPEILTEFMEKLLGIPQNNPVLVHCNAGCGRTGTVILCDMALRKMAREGTVDFLGILYKMRQQRAFLVTRVQQYIFAHFVVLHYNLNPKSSILLNADFQDEIQDLLGEENIKKLLRNVDRDEKLFLKFSEFPPPVVTDDDKVKNRFSTILPERSQIFLDPSSKFSNYINAIKVDCICSPRKFILTQQPLPNTVFDFWRLVTDFEITTIVSLNRLGDDPNCPVFWKDEASLKLLEVTKFHAYDIIRVQLMLSGRGVNIINVKTWGREEDSPPDPEDFLELWNETFRVQGKNQNSILLTCYDGCSASGLFVALDVMLNKIKVERICDMYSAVKFARCHRAQFAQNSDQIEFLCKAAVEYVTKLN